MLGAESCDLLRPDHRPHKVPRCPQNRPPSSTLAVAVRRVPHLELCGGSLRPPGWSFSFDPPCGTADDQVTLGTSPCIGTIRIVVVACEVLLLSDSENWLQRVTVMAGQHVTFSSPSLLGTTPKMSKRS